MSPTTGKQPQSGDGAWTKGTWRVEDDESVTRIYAEVGLRIADAHSSNRRGLSAAERLANANLIAAAPDLYEALRLVMPIVRGADARTTNPGGTALLAFCEAVLAKARGDIPVERAIDHLTRSFAEDAEVI